jgi:hypothetical protein
MHIQTENMWRRFCRDWLARHGTDQDGRADCVSACNFDPLSGVIGVQN